MLYIAAFMLAECAACMLANLRSVCLTRPQQGGSDIKQLRRLIRPFHVFIGKTIEGGSFCSLYF